MSRNGKHYAVKTARGADYDCKRYSNDALEREMKLYKKIGRHAGIIDMLACKRCFHDPYIVMPLAAHGTLFDYVGTAKIAGQWTKVTKVKTSVIVLDQLLPMLARLEAVNIAHLDIKVENILVLSKDPLRVCLADLGLAKDFDEADEKDFGGWNPTRIIAPEAARMDGRSKNRYDTRADVWMLGCLILELLGVVPRIGYDMSNMTHAAPLDALKQTQRDGMARAYWGTLSAAAYHETWVPFQMRHILEEMMVVDYEQRKRASVLAKQWAAISPSVTMPWEF